ncbi:GNAT family N-acetyltransferase [Devosia sp.]|uniref:GNAT family N-acetyltransferase n=1 Tax=Devosia sp. TaxID=1871048 RepID=UPI001B01BF91|nr:GNAT family N-acetyltransferase [Devosia sp.]MBO9589486.1 GNAT family N-acetyltransferase [Devosia sp.]
MSLPLETARLRLTPAVLEDWREYHPILADPASGHRSNLPRNPTQKRTQGVVAWMVRIGKTGKGFAWMIRDRETGQLLGCIRINSIDHEQSTGIIGYEIGSGFWGRGYGTEALRAVAQHGHREMGLFRLEAWTLEGNEQSDRVLLKAGFLYEGKQRQKMVLDGQRLDMSLFGRLADDPVAATPPPAT